MAISEKTEVKTALKSVVFYLDSYVSSMNPKDVKDFLSPSYGDRYLSQKQWDLSLNIINFFKLCNQEIFQISQAYDFFEIFDLSEMIETLQCFLYKLKSYVFDNECESLLQNQYFNLVVIEGLIYCIDKVIYYVHLL